jgi:hypothetical protein
MLEYVVRPFQSPGAHGAIIIPSTPSGSRERATITWTAESTLPDAKFTGIAVTSKKEDGIETGRDSEMVRIIGNDPDNFIDVVRANKLYIDKTVSGADPGNTGQTISNPLADRLAPAGVSKTNAASPTNEKIKATLKLSNNTSQG